MTRKARREAAQRAQERFERRLASLDVLADMEAKSGLPLRGRIVA